MSAHYFIAIPLPDDLKEYYSLLQVWLKKELPYRQWTYKDDLHITLKFLGAVESCNIGQLKKALRELETFCPFYIGTGAIGFFGHPQQPRVLWAGAEKTDPLTAIQKKVEEIAETWGFPPEKRMYKPHITLAKKWDGSPDGKVSEKMDQPGLTEPRRLYIDEVVLYQIHPQAKPKYEVVASYRLSGGDRHRSAH